MSTGSSQALDQRVPTVHLFAAVESDLPKVEAAIEAAVETREGFVADVSTHLLRGGGKRIRPALVLLCAKAGEYRLNRLLPVAAAVELIHMATLVHDDVVDASATRRGLPTVNAKWNSGVSVLTGDYLFAKAFSLLAGVGAPRIVEIMADVVFAMSQGELQQMASASDPDQTVEDYFDRIRKKTGYFIAESCRVGAVVARLPADVVDAVYRFGLGVGTGFQIIDDILDFTANTWQLGKPAAADLRSGLITLPVIHALAASPPAERERLRGLLRQRPIPEEGIALALGAVHRSGALQEAGRMATEQIQRAKAELDRLPESAAKATLHQVADFVLRRKF